MVGGKKRKKSRLLSGCILAVRCVFRGDGALSFAQTGSVSGGATTFTTRVPDLDPKNSVGGRSVTERSQK